MYLLKERKPYARLVSIFTKTEKSPVAVAAKKTSRIESIDVLRGLVMVIMALDHVRDYFHKDAFLYSPTDLSRTSLWLFGTRWLTHFCAPIFVFLAGISAYQYGIRRGRTELVFFLWTRGLWLVFIEIVILSLFRSFNLSFPFFSLQVIWAIGICMIVLSAIVQTNAKAIAIIAVTLIAAHNILDQIHIPGNGAAAFIWSVLHDENKFTYGTFTFYVHYPVIPWIGLMTLGYYLGRLYTPGFDGERRRTLLIIMGLISIVFFVNLRYTNWYGDPHKWTVQQTQLRTLLSFFNVTKYPPSLLYMLITFGPALVFLALSEKPLNSLTSKLAMFGRTAMFYYLAHILLIHVLALFGARMQGFPWSSMVLSTKVDDSATLKGYGFSLPVVYLIWIALVLILYPICKWYDQYKRNNVHQKWWLSYL